MKLLALSSTLSLATLVSAVPGHQWQRRQNGSVPLTNTTSIPNGAAVGPQQTGLTTVTTTTTVTNTINGAVSVNTLAVAVVLSIGVNGASVPVATIGSNPVTGSGAIVQGPGAVFPGGVAAAPAAQATAAGSVCTCVSPAVVATGIYTATVVNKVDLGTSTFTTTYPTTTLGRITVQGGQIIPATPTITYVAAVATNTNAPLAPGQFYSAIQVPGANGVFISINIIVTVSSTTSTSINNNNNGGSAIGPVGSGPFSNSTSSANTGGASVGAVNTATSGVSSSSTSAAAGSAITNTSGPVTNAPTTASTANPAGSTGVTVGSLGQTPLYNQQAFINQMLADHNSYRTRHGGPDVTWNQDLANVALANVQANAQAAATTSPAPLTHSRDMPGVSDPYGENIGAQFGQNNPSYLVYLWYNEINSYNFNNPGFSEATGHFTQVVWKASTQIGCAYTQANDANKTFYLACEYNQPGNVDGGYQANVVPPTSNSAVVPPATNI